MHVALNGLVAVHAVRAVWTALAAVPGILSAEVSMAGAILDVTAPVDEGALRRAIDEALAPIGVETRSLRVESGRTLPTM